MLFGKTPNLSYDLIKSKTSLAYRYKIFNQSSLNKTVLTEIKKNLIDKKNVLISAHGNSLRALCKYLFNISDSKINELEIPTGNPLIIEFENNLKVSKYYYLDETRAKDIIFNQ